MKTITDYNNVTIVTKMKPAYAVSSIIIDDHDNVYVANGSDYFKMNFIQEISGLIRSTKGNQGWQVIDPSSGKQYLPQTLEALYTKDYIGNDCDHKDQSIVEGKF